MRDEKSSKIFEIFLQPTCSNHDDGETGAIIQCSVCGNLCAECDRFLHLHRRTRMHQRQVHFTARIVKEGFFRISFQVYEVSLCKILFLS